MPPRITHGEKVELVKKIQAKIQDNPGMLPEACAAFGIHQSSYWRYQQTIGSHSGRLERKAEVSRDEMASIVGRVNKAIQENPKISLAAACQQQGTELSSYNYYKNILAGAAFAQTLKKPKNDIIPTSRMAQVAMKASNEVSTIVDITPSKEKALVPKKEEEVETPPAKEMVRVMIIETTVEAAAELLKRYAWTNGEE
jgi:ACT domain-containing protein